MLNYSKTIKNIADAIDTDEVDKIIDNFVESISVQNSEEKIISEFYIHIKKELAVASYEIANKMKRAMTLIECHADL